MVQSLGWCRASRGSPQSPRPAGEARRLKKHATPRQRIPGGTWSSRHPPRRRSNRGTLNKHTRQYAYLNKSDGKRGGAANRRRTGDGKRGGGRRRWRQGRCARVYGVALKESFGWATHALAAFYMAVPNRSPGPLWGPAGGTGRGAGARTPDGRQVGRVAKIRPPPPTARGGAPAAP